MDSKDLSQRQAAIIRDRLVPLTRLLHKWQYRMRQTEFPPGDPLALATNAALSRLRASGEHRAEGGRAACRAISHA